MVEKDAYLLELMRYVVLNPVRAGMVGETGDWPWSSYGSMIGISSRPDWLETDWVLGQFGNTHGEAVMDYIDFPNNCQIHRGGRELLRSGIC